MTYTLDKGTQSFGGRHIVDRTRFLHKHNIEHTHTYIRVRTRYPSNNVITTGQRSLKGNRCGNPPEEGEVVSDWHTEWNRLPFYRLNYISLRTFRGHVTPNGKNDETLGLWWSHSFGSGRRTSFSLCTSSLFVRIVSTRSVHQEFYTRGLIVVVIGNIWTMFTFKRSEWG